MLRAVFAIGLALALSLPDCTQAQQTADLPLLHAAEMGEDRHVILTAPMGPSSEAVARAEAVAAQVDGEVVAVWPLAAIEVFCYVIRLPAGADPDVAKAELLGDPDVLTAQPVTSFELLDARYDDDLLPIQDSLRGMNVLAAHEITTGLGVTIALIDSAVDTHHPDLAHQNILLRDLVDPAMPQAVAERHGTAMAALIVADARNRIGMVGVAPDANLLALRACWSEASGAERCSNFSLARAINYALLNGADVINLSLGGPYDPLLAALLEAAEERGVVVVAAHGPNASPLFPASLSSVIAAVATGPEATDGGYSAPGQDVISAVPGNRYDFFSGDSVSSAHLSGVVALLLALERDLSPSTIRDALGRASDDARYGFDACVAVQAGIQSPAVHCD
jgi:subtilisin family serine protease